MLDAGEDVNGVLYGRGLLLLCLKLVAGPGNFSWKLKSRSTISACNSSMLLSSKVDSYGAVIESTLERHLGNDGVMDGSRRRRKARIEVQNDR